MRKLSRNTLLTLLVGFVASTAIYVGSRALAEGVPPTPTMYYSGVIEEDDALITGTRNMSVALWTTESGGTGLACATSPVPIEVEEGNFRVGLSDACTQAVRDNPELWAELTVGAETLPRTRLGAVPYAIEAEHAVTATRANSAAEADYAEESSVAESGVADFTVNGDLHSGTVYAGNEGVVTDGVVFVGWDVVESPPAPVQPGDEDGPFAACVEGVALGGGCRIGNQDGAMVVSGWPHFSATLGWGYSCYLNNDTATERTVVAYAICARLGDEL